VKRRWNISIGVGFLIVVAGVFAYPIVFLRFPITRDVPWASFLILAAGLLLTARGLGRAYREPQVYRGKIAGPIFMILGLGLAGFFAFGTLYQARQLPASAGAPRVGQKAPDFRLPDADGHEVGLSEMLGSGAAVADRPHGVLLIFYRGYW